MAEYNLTPTQGQGIDEFILRGRFIWPDEKIADIYGVPIEFVQQRRTLLEMSNQRVPVHLGEDPTEHLNYQPMPYSEPRSTIEQDVDPAGEEQIKRDLEEGRNYQEEPFDLRGMIGDALRNVAESGPSQRVRGLLEEVDLDTFGELFKDVLFKMGVDFPLINPGARNRKYGKRIPYPGEEEEFEEWRP